ncbi:hypothetical protein BU15DRAFT_14666, partial [Melanogaster broomeanus]
QEYKETLYSLAVTCRAFKETALDVLWFDLDSLHPLLQCLPVDFHRRSDGCVVSDPSYVTRLVIFTLALQLLDRALEPEDFEVFQKYAPRVRTVAYRRRSHDLSKDLVRILSNFPCTPGTALLPNLKALVWDGDSDEIMPFFRYLVPPTLIHLHFPGSEWPQCKLSFLSFLHKHIPHLKEFTCVDSDPDALPRIDEYICNAEHLSKVDVGLPGEEAMKHLVKSTTLRHLLISLPPYNLWEPVEGAFPPSLTHFTLRAYRLDKAAEYLRT